MIIEDKTDWGRVDRFAVVDEWPQGYVVWHIGRANFRHEGYLPLCTELFGHRVDLSSLKALYVGDEDLCMKVLKDYGTVDYERFKQIRDE